MTITYPYRKTSSPDTSRRVTQTSTGQPVALVFGAACATMFLDFEFSPGGIRVRIFDIVLLLLLVSYTVSLVMARRARRTPGMDFLVVYLLYVGYCAVNALLLASAKTAVIETAQALSFAIFFWILTDLLENEKRAKSFIAGFLIGMWAISMGNAAFFISGGQVYDFKSTGPQKLSHAYSLIATVVLAMYGDRRYRPFLISLVLIAAALTLLAGERKGWLAAIAALGVLAATSDTGRIRVGRVVQRVVVILALAIPIALIADGNTGASYTSRQIESTVSAFDKAFNPAYNPITDIHESISNRSRIYITNLGRDIVASHPFFGIGLDNFIPYAEQKTIGLPRGLLAGIHNEYLRIAAETGLVGLALYLAGISLILRRAAIGIRSLPHLNDHLRLRLRIGVALLVFGLVINMFRATSGGSALMLFLPAALIYFPALALRMPDGSLRLASKPKVEQAPASES